MCIEVLVKIDGHNIYCKTVGELADALSMPAESVSDDPRDGCLCNTLWGPIGARLATEDEGFPWPEYVIEVMPNAGQE